MYLLITLIPLIGCSYKVEGLWDEPVHHLPKIEHSHGIENEILPDPYG